jgi:hypothetical protein
MKKIATLMTVSVLALGLASPAFAQSSNGGSGTIQSGFGNDSTTVNDLLDLYTQNSGNNTNSGNSADTANLALGNTIDSGNVNGSNQVTANQELTATITNRGAMNFNGGNGGDADADADASSDAAAAGSVAIGVANAAAAASSAAAGAAGDGGDGDSDYRSGSNSINDNAFAAYAGILTQGWNSGINANVQAGTNLAAQGTVNFGPN